MSETDFVAEIAVDKPARRSPRRNRSDSAEPVRRVIVDDEPVGGDSAEAIERELNSNVKMTPERRKALARRRRTLLTRPEDNPFLNEKPGVLPVLPFEEDPSHVYHWMRDTLYGERDGDRSNIAAKTTGHLRYEIVRMETLPEHWQARASPFATADGRIRYKDVILTRTSRRMRDMKLAAMEREADVAADQLNGRLRAQVAAKGNTRARIEEDVEE